MAGHRYQGRDKVVQKMTREGLVEENLHSGEKKNISHRLKDVPSVGEIKSARQRMERGKETAEATPSSRTSQRLRNQRSIGQRAAPEAAENGTSNTAPIAAGQSGIASDFHETEPVQHRPFHVTDSVQFDAVPDSRAAESVRANIFRAAAPVQPDAVHDSRAAEPEQTEQSTTWAMSASRRNDFHNEAAPERTDGNTQADISDGTAPVPETFTVREHPARELYSYPPVVSDRHAADFVQAAVETRHKQKKKQVEKAAHKRMEQEEKTEAAFEEAADSARETWERQTKPDVSSEPDHDAGKMKKRKPLYDSAPGDSAADVVGEAAGKKSRLSFDDEDGSGMVRGSGMSLHKRAARAAAAQASVYVHGKIHQVEKENAGVEGAHKSELAAEAAVREAGGMVHRNRVKNRSVRQAKKKAKSASKDRLKFSDKEGAAAASNTPGTALARLPGKAPAEVERDKKSRIMVFWQKKRYKEAYAAARNGKTATGEAAKATESAAAKIKKAVQSFFGDNKGLLIALAILALMFLLISVSLSSCTAIFQGVEGTFVGTTYPSEDADILGAEEDYCAMEEELRQKIQELQEDEDYDEIELNVDEIGHDPWKLASLLTVLYGDYTREEVQGFLRQLFEAQYELSTSTSIKTETETKTVRVGESLGTVTTSGYCNCVICCGSWSGGPTASGVYPTANHTLAVDASNPFVPIGTKVVMNGVEYTVEDTGNFARYGVQFDVYYDNHLAATLHGHQQWECYLADDNGSNTVEVTTTETKRILTVTATNHTLESVIENLGLTDEEMERYEILVATKGNRSYLFEDDIYSNATEGFADYDIPLEALSDEKFRNMITEAEKYLGYPYVWGGSSPSTSFDCSGFVSYVINNCGNGWNVGRQTADGLRSCCEYVSPSEAKPGDLIFFQGTYNTSGASHVGIYVGNGMMIHCGNPIQYTSIETTYWQEHFLAFGRIGG